MPLPKRPVHSLDDINQKRRDRETINQILDHTFDDSRVQTPAEIAADITPVNKAFPPGDVRRYMTTEQIADVVAGTLTLDCSAAFTNCIAANSRSTAPEGSYRLDSTVTVTTSKSLILRKGTILSRGGTATTPVVGVIGSFAELRGGAITSANASPDGVVVLGHPNTSTDMDSVWWRFTDCDVSGRVNQAGDIIVNVPSSQVDFVGRANYFGTIANINIHGGDIQLYLPELSNAHNINNVQFWNGKTAGFRLRGAYANNANNLFFHQSAASGYVAIQLQDQVDSGGQHHSIFNQIINWTSETLFAADRSLEVEANCELNYIVGGSNVLGGWTISNDNNHIVLNSGTVATPGIICSGTISAEDVTASDTLTVGLASQLAVAATTGIASGAGVAAGAAVTIIPSAALTIQKATLVLVNIFNTSTNGNLSRSDLLLLNLRNNAHSASTVTVVSSSITLTGGNGDPTDATYTLDFGDGSGLPKLQVSITSVGGPQTFTAEPTFVKV